MTGEVLAFQSCARAARETHKSEPDGRERGSSQHIRLAARLGRTPWAHTLGARLGRMPWAHALGARLSSVPSHACERDGSPA